MTRQRGAVRGSARGAEAASAGAAGRPRRSGHLGRPISQRPPTIERRTRLGHYEIDTLVGHGSQACILSLVERKSGYAILGPLPDRTATAFTARATRLIRQQPRPVRTITADAALEHDGLLAEGFPSSGDENDLGKPHQGANREREAVPEDGADGEEYEFENGAVSPQVPCPISGEELHEADG